MGLNVSEFSLNGDYGSFFDGETVICTIDKKEYTILFSFMAQISKSDFGIFYGVNVFLDSSISPVNTAHSGATGRFALYILPAVYVMAKPSKPASNEGGGSGGQGGENSEGGGSDSGGQGNEKQYG